MSNLPKVNKQIGVTNDQTSLAFVQLIGVVVLAISLMEILSQFIDPNKGMALIFAIDIFTSLTTYNITSRITGVWILGPSRAHSKIQKREKEFRTFPKAIFQILLLSLVIYFVVRLSV
jgi:hypothetical protein